MKVLQLTVHYQPNVGGVETHLADLVRALLKRKHKVFVLAYQPLMSDVDWKLIEKKRDYRVFRIPWLPGLFYKLLSSPILEFFYLVPGLFLVTPFALRDFKPDIIHAHGLVAGFVGVFWGKVYKTRTVVSTHSVYHFPKKGLYTEFVKWIFENSDFNISLSKKAVEEIVGLGIERTKVNNFTYWVDLSKFKPKDSKLKVKKKLGWESDFVVLFVGRLVEEKGLPELLKAAQSWNQNISLVIAGGGPMESNVKSQTSKVKTIKYLGRVSQDKLPQYYSAADIVVVPSTHEEGFGRVILESLACGTPVIGANRGAIPEAMDESVGRLIDVTPANIKKAVEYFYNNPDRLRKLKSKTRKYAESYYSEKNVEKIVDVYK